MAIERNNSFHLLLSDDELNLLKLLAERDGLNASDYLRMLIRMMPSTTIAQLRRSHAHRCRTRRRAHSCNRLSLIGPAESCMQAGIVVRR
ncbi:MAG: hypothetical protein ABTD50_20540 [Polyangiaceae bacterium]|jgi:hypothetical protein